jgi:hypothetical protein
VVLSPRAGLPKRAQLQYTKTPEAQETPASPNILQRNASMHNICHTVGLSAPSMMT